MALGAGATAAEVVVREGIEFSTSVRLGRVEKLQQASFRKLGLHIFQDGYSAVSATSDFSLEILSHLVRDTLDMARAAGEDPAAGLWIENGELAFPVEEITVAGNLRDMLTSIEAVGNDLLILGETFAPTLLIGKMVVSGE